MGLFSFLKSQFIEVIEWTDNTGVIVHRFPVHNHQIKMGARLTVRESQNAVFVNEGQIADKFTPGLYTLSTQNMPVLTVLKSWKYGFNSPFKAEVYFLNMSNFTDLKWGTANPVMMRDKEFGVVRLRGFGNYSFKVIDPVLFLKDIVGTKQDYSAEKIEGYLKTTIVTDISDMLAESGIPAIDLAASYKELSGLAAERVGVHFAQIGLELTGLNIENISLPPEVEAMIDRKSSMNIAGNLDQYAKYQTAEAIREAANNPDGGAASAGIGMGAGMAMAQMMRDMAAAPAASTPAPTAAGAAASAAAPAPASASAQPPADIQQEKARFCSSCGKPVTPDAAFCSGCGHKL